MKRKWRFMTVLAVCILAGFSGRAGASGEPLYSREREKVGEPLYGEEPQIREMTEEQADPEERKVPQDRRTSEEQEDREVPENRRTSEELSDPEDREIPQDRRTSEEQADQEDLTARYQVYRENFESIRHTADIEEYGYELAEDQCFSVLLESFGEEEVRFLSAIEKDYRRVAVFIADQEGNILYKTEQLEMNYKYSGQLKQPVKSLAAVSFQDLNHDGRKDIVLIAECENAEGSYAGRSYKIGEVLFQQDGNFYRDWRISDKINRFSMNKSADFIAAYVRDGNSTESLYTAVTLDELTDSGFQVFEEQNYYRQFEKQGFLNVVPGVMSMAEYDVFMIFLVNENGYIVWSFQPMGDYDNLYAMKGMACKDVDGDGMKDIVVLARYSYTDEEGERHVDPRCSIYYQRTDGFAEDKDFVRTYQCTEEDTVGGLVESIREYWGWKQEK